MKEAQWEMPRGMANELVKERMAHAELVMAEKGLTAQESDLLKKASARSSLGVSKQWTCW